MRRKRRGKLCGGKRLEEPPRGAVCGVRPLSAGCSAARLGHQRGRELKENAAENGGGADKGWY